MEFLKQFNIIENDEFDLTVMAQYLYMAFLNKFKIMMSEEEYKILQIFQERVYDLVDHMREMSTNDIADLFTLINEINPVLADLVIMSWCLPRSDDHFSKKFYFKKYITILISMIEHPIIKAFCLETLNKTNNVPVHCIDLIWYYMNQIELELLFVNEEGSTYIGINVDSHEIIKISLNLEFILKSDLCRVSFPNDPFKKGPLLKLLKEFIINPMLISKIKNPNYKSQLINISKNPKLYHLDINEVLSLDQINKIIDNDK